MFYAPADPEARSDWGIVCTCREPTQLVVAFVAHHVALGAREVHLFLDAPQPDLEALLTHVPQVRLEICDDSYWQRIDKQRPRSVEHRQLINAFVAYERAGVSWLAHVDADEFLHADLDIGEMLGAQPAELDFLVLEPRERCFVEGVPQEGLFDGVFRRPVPEVWGAARFLFGAAGRYLRKGLLGHSIGKCFMRTGQELVPGIHTPRRPSGARKKRVQGWYVMRARLLHFDGLTALHWTAKMRRAAAAQSDQRFLSGAARDSHRARQIMRMRRLGQRKHRVMKMHDMLKVVPQDQLDRQIAMGMIETYHIDPAQAVAALNLPVEIDMSAEAFDAALIRERPEIVVWDGEGADDPGAKQRQAGKVHAAE